MYIFQSAQANERKEEGDNIQKPAGGEGKQKHARLENHRSRVDLSFGRFRRSSNFEEEKKYYPILEL